jgi:predicted dehydrogenase
MVDTEEWAAEDLAENYDVPYGTDIDLVLGDPDVDLVYLATPHHLHAPQTIKAAEAGKHVLVEKPMATSISDAEDMIEAADEAGIVLSVAINSVMSAKVQRARELIEEGYLGDITGMRIKKFIDKGSEYWSGGYSGRVETDWRTSKDAAGGGILLMNVSHDLARIREATDMEAVRVSAECDTFATPVEVEDYASVTVRFDNGAIGNIHTSSFLDASPPGYSEPNQIYGTEGELVLSDPLWLRTEEESKFGPAGEWHEVEFGETDTISAYLDSLATAIQEGGDPPVSGRDGLAILKIPLGAYRASDQEAPVELSHQDP